jgi:hypothetical protein
MKRMGAVFGLALTLAACASETPRRPAPSPIWEAPSPPPPPPAATVVGHGVYRTRTGARGDCAGLSVALMHDTPSYRQRMIALYGSAENARLAVATVKARSARLGPAESPLAASVSCDGAGAFVFPDVAAGSYFIIARVKITSIQGASEDLVVMRHLVLAEGETRDVSLAP